MKVSTIITTFKKKKKGKENLDDSITIKKKISLQKNPVMDIKENVEQHSSCGILRSGDTTASNFSNSFLYVSGEGGFV